MTALDHVDVRPEPRVTGMPVDSRIEVRTTADDEAVEAVEQRGGVVD